MSDQTEPISASPVAEPDRTVGVLRLIVGGLLVVVLVMALVFAIYVQGIRAPRSTIERDLARYRAAVLEQPELLDNHIRLAYTYAEAGRFDDAFDSIETAERMNDEPRAVVQLARADITRESGDLTAAVEEYGRASETAKAEYQARKEQLAERNTFSQPPDEVLARVLQGRAVALWESGDASAAIGDLEAALRIVPSDAAMLVALGQYQVKEGNDASATASFRKALEFVPDYPEALEGLRALGGGE